jgi:hypothetical protein
MGMLRVPHMQKVPWDPLKDFTFIMGVSGYTFGLTVRADSPYKTFNDYIEAARKSPGKIDYGSTGVGTLPHLLMEELAANAKVSLNYIPFKGNADLTQAVLGGHVMAQSDAPAGTSWSRPASCACSSPSARSAPSAGLPCRRRRSSATTSSPPRRTGSSVPRAWTRRSPRPCTTRSRRRWTSPGTSSSLIS